MSQSAFGSKVSEILMPLGLGNTSQRFLDILDQPNADDAALLKNVLESNPLYCQWLENSKWDLLKKSKWAESDAKMSAAQILYLRGGAHVRDALLTLRLMRMNPNEAPKAVGATPTISPEKKLFHALEIEKISQDQRYAHERTSYRAGLIFDQLSANFDQKKMLSAAAQTARSECWKMGLKAGRVVYQLGSDLKFFKYQKYAVASGILLFAGIWVMHVRHAAASAEGPSYKEFIDRMKKQQLYRDPEIAEIFEAKAYDLTAAAWSSLIASFSETFRPIEKALFYVNRPYFLRKKHPDLFRLSILLATGYQAAIEGKLTEFHQKRLVEIGVRSSDLKGVVG